MDIYTDQQTISQDWPTEESFERKEIFKWRNISDAIYKIKKVNFRKGKYGDSAILTLETKNGDEYKRPDGRCLLSICLQNRSQNFC